MTIKAPRPPTPTPSTQPHVGASARAALRYAGLIHRTVCPTIDSALAAPSPSRDTSVLTAGRPHIMTRWDTRRGGRYPLRGNPANAAIIGTRRCAHAASYHRLADAPPRGLGGR